MSSTRLASFPPPVCAVASGSQYTTEAGLQVLEKGGNAWDAAIAALAMAFVAEPLLASPGGGGYLLSDPAKGEAQVLDFFAQTPRKRPAETDALDFYPIHGDFGGASQEFHIGAAAAAVPGAIAGLLAIHRHHARLPLGELLQAAIEAAREGIVLEDSQRQVASILTPIITNNETTRATFAPQANGFYRNPALAEFLQQLAELGSEAGHDWFYRGPVAETIAAIEGGLIEGDDLADYAVIRRTPLVAEFPGYTVLTNPPPSTGGRLIVAQLRFAHQSKLDEPLKLAEAMRAADGMKSQSSRSGTTHISVCDSAGNRVALTVSNGEGNGRVVEPYGFMLNNFLGEEDINPGGFFQWKPGSRMASMMAPTALHRTDKTREGNDSEAALMASRFALGSGGSNRIKTALFQVIWHAMASGGRGKPLNFAVSHPRLHYENGLLDIEAGWSAEAIAQLTRAFPNYRLWDKPSLYFGGVNAVQSGQTHTAIGDFRRQGCGQTRALATAAPDSP